ncbi:YafY family transcriptional regulator [bacterium 1xD42-62]|uniref:YafY family transcriptional regulator n=1 Tax=Parablautia muri TaxID=2320879 RepID=A0A9X5BHX1_9FIRM|nr:YafY family protein [Parablautia muri]NBJ94063.1 YafY family transcriptional regulator [Parablautia muri]
MSDSRLFKILYYLLDREHATAPELAAEFEVSTRTIYRDVEALSSAGIPVYAEPGRNGGIYLLQDFVLDKAILSENEKQEVLMAIQSIFATGYTGGKEILTKLSALFNVNTRNWLEVDFTCWGKNAYDNTKFEQLKTAVTQCKEIEIVYENTNSERSKRIIQPLKISYKSKEWYLKAFCTKRQDFRIFKLNRILKLELLENTFVPKPYPEPENNLSQTFPRLILLFSKEIAYRVYDEFDVTEIEYQKNGDLLVCTAMPIDTWLIGYLLSFGAQVEILEPKYLKGVLAEQAQEIYKKNKP